LAFEAAGLLNQASDPHSNSSRLTSFELMNLPIIFTSLLSLLSAILNVAYAGINFTPVAPVSCGLVTRAFLI
jgi:hypothetical protein